MERQLKQLEGCINYHFADGTGDVRESMVKFHAAKCNALGALQALLDRPGSGDGATRPLHEHPACSWAVFWPTTREARGDFSSLVGYNRHFLSCACHARNECWLPYAIVERMVLTGTLILNSVLGDLRKLSPELNVPAELPDNLQVA